MENTNSKRVTLVRLTTRISQQAMLYLQEECDRRYESEAARVPYGKVLTAVLIERFGPQATPALVRKKSA
jgi:hypothetical protein